MFIVLNRKYKFLNCCNTKTSVIDSGGVSYRYAYDELSQLIREDDIKDGKTIIYTYDNAGNILSMRTYAIADEGVTPSGEYTEKIFGYNDAGNGDLLTSVDGNGITYDALGNPIQYYNGYILTWDAGRRLSSVTKPDGTVITYTYNDEGIRTSKTVDGVLHKYILNGSQIVGEKVGQDYFYFYLFDAEGTPIGAQYMYYPTGDLKTYMFEKNLQGSNPKTVDNCFGAAKPPQATSGRSRVNRGDRTRLCDGGET